MRSPDARGKGPNSSCGISLKVPFRGSTSWHCDITNVLWPHGLSTHWKHTYHMRQPITPLTSDTPRLRQHVLRSPVARRHANALPTKAAQIPMALRHHERTLATRSVHTLEAHISHETANHPAHQRHAAFTPACLARGHANALPTKAAQIPMALRHHERSLATRSVHTLEANISHNTTNDPAHQRHAAFMPTQTHFPPRPRKSQWHCDVTNVLWPHGPPHTRSKHITRYP